MPGIDDPIEAANKQHQESADPILETLLNVAGKFDLFTGVVSAIRQHFSKKAANEKINALLKVLESEIRQNERKLNDLSSRIESAEFVETLIVAVSESLRTADLDKIRRFAAILGHTLVSDQRNKKWDDAAAYIRDIAQLGEGDIEALRILYSVQRDAVLGEDPTDPNRYTATIKQVLTAVDESGISRDEFYSRCSRLNGFGLALEVQRNDGRMAPNDHCFRLTGRAAELIAIIEDTGSMEA